VSHADVTVQKVSQDAACVILGASILYLL